MISNEEFKMIIASFNELHNNNSLFSVTREIIANKKEKNTFLPTQLVEIKEAYSKRKEQLENFKKDTSKLEYIMNHEVFKPFLAAVNNEIASLDMMVSDVSRYIETMDPKYIASVLYGFDLEREQNENLMKASIACEQSLGIYFLNQVQTKQMDFSDLKSLNTDLDPNSILYQRISEVIAIIEKSKEPDLVPVEQKSTEQNATVDNEATVSNTMPVLEEKEKILENTTKTNEITLQDKLNQLNYVLGNNLHAEVQTITAEDSLIDVAKQIQVLDSKDKLSFRETIQLHTLREQELGIQAYMSNIEVQNLAFGDRIRENKLSKNSSKIEIAQSNLVSSRESSQNYDSKFMRFFSMRYQEQLQVNIANLRQKNGILASIQKESAVAKFDKKSRKISRRAKFAGLISGTKQIATNKITELKLLKDEVLSEFGKIKQDIGRFSSDRDSITRLQLKNGATLDNIINIEEHTQSHRMSA